MTVSIWQPSPGAFLFWMIAGAALVLMIGFSIYAILFLPPGPQFTRATAECDKQVEILLTSRDPVELQRAGLLIRELNCNVIRRLP